MTGEDILRMAREDVSHIWAAEWCDCIYEAGFTVISLHATACGAYRAMRAKLLPAWDEDRARRFRRKGDRTLDSQRWRIKKYEVLP